MNLVLVKLLLKIKANNQLKTRLKLIKILGKTMVAAVPQNMKHQRSYTVQEGDSLSKIARENNTSVHHLEQINDLESADSISIGQSIKLK